MNSLGKYKERHAGVVLDGQGRGAWFGEKAQCRFPVLRWGGMLGRNGEVTYGAGT